MRGTSSSIGVAESEPSSERTWPPREDERSCTTAPRLDSLTYTVTIITGSSSAAGAVAQDVRRRLATAARVAMEMAVGVVSVKRFADASRLIVTRALATGKPLNGPRARAADAPAWIEWRI